jgi:hypothetical protein
MTARRPIVLVNGSPAELPAGDRLAGTGWQEVANATLSSASATTDFTVPSGYSDLMVLFDHVIASSSGVLSLYFATQAAPTTFGAAVALANLPITLGAYNGGVLLPAYMLDMGPVLPGLQVTNNPSATAGGTMANIARETIGGIGGLRFTIATSWNSGTMRLLLKS